MKIEDMSHWEAFLGVAKEGNFSRASRHLGVPTPQISKRVAKLEDQLGVRLFHRSTRVVSLTDEGRALLPRISAVMEDLSGIESQFEGEKHLRGTVKVTCVPFIAHKLLLPAMEEFQLRFPDIHLDFELTKKFTNIIEQGFDMAIRIETPNDTDLIYRKLAPNDLVLVATPEYLKKNGRPLSEPSDLKNHRLLVLKIHHRCRFEDQAAQLGDFIDSKPLSCDSGIFLTDLARNHGGILVRSIWDVKKELDEGVFQQVLSKYPLETFGYIHAVVPSQRYLAPRVRAFLDFVVEKARAWT